MSSLLVYTTVRELCTKLIYSSHNNITMQVLSTLDVIPEYILLTGLFECDVSNREKSMLHVLYVATHTCVQFNLSSYENNFSMTKIVSGL